VQDTARAKDILGRTATLEARLVDLSAEGQSAITSQGPVPFGSELFRQGRGAPVVLKKEPIFTGEQLTSAAATFDENQRAAVAISLNDPAGRRLREVSRENIKKPMAVVLFERGRGEVLTVATIQSELGSRFQITGMDSPQASNDLALLLRAGSLAAPMVIVERKIIVRGCSVRNIRESSYGEGLRGSHFRVSSVEDADEAAIPAVRNRVGSAPVGPGARRRAGGSPWVALRVAVVRILHTAAGRHWRFGVDGLGLVVFQMESATSLFCSERIAFRLESWTI
jgi:hypothetical protein